MSKRGLALTQALLNDIKFYKYGIDELGHYAINQPESSQYQEFKEHFNTHLRNLSVSQSVKLFKKHQVQ